MRIAVFYPFEGAYFKDPNISCCDILGHFWLGGYPPSLLLSLLEDTPSRAHPLVVLGVEATEHPFEVDNVKKRESEVPEGERERESYHL